MRQYLKNEVFKVSKWVELFISAIIMIAVIGGTIYLVKDVVQLMMNYPTSRDIYKFVGVAFNLVICIEFVKMLCKHTPDTLVEVMMFAIARQMIVEHTSPQQNLLVVLAIAILFAIKKFLFGNLFIADCGNRIRQEDEYLVQSLGGGLGGCGGLCFRLGCFCICRFFLSARRGGSCQHEGGDSGHCRRADEF